jgi:hypothetical protein
VTARSPRPGKDACCRVRHLAHLAAGTRAPVGQCIVLIAGDDELTELTGDEMLVRIDQHASDAGLDPMPVGDRLLLDQLWQGWELSGVHRAGAYLDRLADRRDWADIDDLTLMQELANALRPRTPRTGSRPGRLAAHRRDQVHVGQQDGLRPGCTTRTHSRRHAQPINVSWRSGA